MIEAINLTKRYEDGTLALDGLTLKVNPGEIYCLLGENGAGKTTTINLFLNFIEPTAGRALINGIDVTRDPLEAKKYVAYLPENVMLYGNFTARQNLDFFAKLGGRRDLRREDYYRVMREIGLPEKAFEQKVKAFSKGMRQKLGLAICMIKQAPAMLLDEPTAGLDPASAAELLHLLRRLREQGRAILMSTHDIFRTKEIADRVGILKQGRLVVELTARELAHENLERLYLEYVAGTTLPRAGDAA
ncbi:putative ABC transporter ATP-binding protein YbhF [bacterium HR10]|nr:putative ABC transporter ATP-binding protein YbhF [bacterium HR10]